MKIYFLNLNRDIQIYVYIKNYNNLNFIIKKKK